MVARFLKGGPMGLDWKPLPKPTAANEARFAEVFLQLTVPDLKPGPKTESLAQEFADLATTSSFETLQAPMVGRDDQAAHWVRRQHEAKNLRSDLLGMSVADAIQDLIGYYVLELVPENDGLPVYCNAAAASGDYLPERSWFRASFLDLCEDVIGAALLADAFNSKMAPALVDYGQALEKKAKTYAKKHQVEHVLTQRSSDWDDENSPEAKAHIVISAAKWCLYWGRQGHGCDADF
jgi:hypothetical protein